MNRIDLKNVKNTISNLANEDDTKFHNWFDPTDSIDETLVRGNWDFSFHILKDKVCEYINNPHEKNVLEIGYGGGRLLNAACNFFNSATGIDIHDNSSKVADFIKSNGNNNFKLIKTDGHSIDLESNSIDLVYSFIVLCHMDSIDKIKSYINESFRVVKSGGLAQLYYLSFRYNRRLGYKNLLNGFHVSFPNEKNNQWTGLPMCRIHDYYMKKLVEKAGFKIIELGKAYRKVPDGYPNNMGMQNYLTLLKK